MALKSKTFEETGKNSIRGGDHGLRTDVEERVHYMVLFFKQTGVMGMLLVAVLPKTSDVCST